MILLCFKAFPFYRFYRLFTKTWRLFKHPHIQPLFTQFKWGQTATKYKKPSNSPFSLIIMNEKLKNKNNIIYFNERFLQFACGAARNSEFSKTKLWRGKLNGFYSNHPNVISKHEKFIFQQSFMSFHAIQWMWHPCPFKEFYGIKMTHEHFENE